MKKNLILWKRMKNKRNDDYSDDDGEGDDVVVVLFVVERMTCTCFLPSWKLQLKSLFLIHLFLQSLPLRPSFSPT
jgi:hypothetical protein